MFRCDPPPALLPEWAGSFTCHCSNVGVERTLNKSEHRKFTLEKEILPLFCGDSNSQPFDHKSSTLPICYPDSPGLCSVSTLPWNALCRWPGLKKMINCWGRHVAEVVGRWFQGAADAGLTPWCSKGIFFLSTSMPTLLQYSYSPWVQSPALLSTHRLNILYVGSRTIVWTREYGTRWVSLWRQNVAARVAMDLKMVTYTIVSKKKSGLSTSVKRGTQENEKNRLCLYMGHTRH